MSKLDLKGKRFGRLTALREIGRRNKYILWECQCDCGNISYVRSSALKTHIRSCGCLLGKNITHGETRNKRVSKLYGIWHGMRVRCYSHISKVYKSYGNKGIKICKEWDNYINFKNWAILAGYQEGLSIDRIDTKGNYTPENCQWIPRGENTAKSNKYRIGMKYNKLREEF